MTLFWLLLKAAILLQQLIKMALSDVKHDDLPEDQKKTTESTKPTNADIASLLKTLTVSVEKLMASAMTSVNLPLLK